MKSTDRSHAGERHALLVGGLGIALDLAQRGVPADTGDDVGRAPSLG
jgi:hypothetical protein